MRTVSKTDVRDVPRWALWLVALVCFVPLTLMWLLGVLYLWFWFAVIFVRLADPERLAHDSSATIWDERPKSHRIFTIAMVAVGLMTLLSFHWPLVGSEPSDFASLISVGGLTYTVLPFAGVAWLLAKSWRFLLAGSVRPDVASRSSRIRRECRDDWWLDA